jgi:hypothetical protein
VAIQTSTATCPSCAEAATQNACSSLRGESKTARAFGGVEMVEEIFHGEKVVVVGSMNGGGGGEGKESGSRSACGSEVGVIASGKGSGEVESESDELGRGRESVGGLLGMVNDGVGFCFVGLHRDAVLCSP